MFAWFFTFSFWVQSVVIGLALLPITALATALVLYLLKRVRDDISGENLRGGLAGIIVFIYAGFVLLPASAHMLLARPLIRYADIDRYLDLWLAAWFIISVLPIYAYSKFDCIDKYRLRRSGYIAIRLLFMPIGLASLLLPLGLLEQAGLVELDNGIRAAVFTIPLFLGVFFFCFVLAHDLIGELMPSEEEPIDLFEEHSDIYRNVLKPGKLWKIATISFYVLTILTFYV